MNLSLPTYSIAQLAYEFAITPRTIRFYENEGLIQPKCVGEIRLYSEADRSRLAWIIRGKRMGFSLAELRLLLDLYQMDSTGAAQLRGLLERSRLHRVEVARRRDTLDTLLADFDAVEAHILAELAALERK